MDRAKEVSIFGGLCAGGTEEEKTCFVKCSQELGGGGGTGGQRRTEGGRKNMVGKTFSGMLGRQAGREDNRMLLLQAFAARLREILRVNWDPPDVLVRSTSFSHMGVFTALNMPWRHVETMPATVHGLCVCVCVCV